MGPNCPNNLKLNGLCVGKEEKRQDFDGTTVKKNKPRNKNCGLRDFSKLVCSKVKAKGRTSYNEVADEIVHEVLSTAKNPEQFEEKNIRRRVYDAFNVLVAIKVIVKDKKEIRWIGFPSTGTNDLALLKEDCAKLRSNVEQKTIFVKELEDKFIDLHNLMARNRQLHDSASIPTEGINLPFLLIKTDPKATVEIEITEDTCLVSFDFNGSPFSLHDSDAILKTIRLARAKEKGRSDSQTLVGSSQLVTN